MVVLVVPCPLALRVRWFWHGVDVCGRWWRTGLQGLGAAVRWWWWALVVVLLLVCPGVWAWGGAVWLDPGLGRGVAPCWRARWRAPWCRCPLVFLAWWVSGADEPPCPRGGDGERARQRCASWRLVLRPLT